MKKYFTALVFFFFLFLYAHGDNINLEFEKGNREFSKTNYQAALDIFLKIDKKVSNWKLFYNTGCTYFKLDDPVNAKIFFLKAEKLKPFNSSIQKNLKIIDKKINSSIKFKNDDFITKLIKRIETILSVNLVSVFLLLAVFVLNYFIFLLIKKGRSRFVVYGVSFSLAVFLFMSVYHFYRTGKAEKKETAVVVKAESRLRSGPGENNTVLFNISRGIKVKIINESNNWIHVSASSDIAGWIESGAITKI